jgi:cell division septation protein DedD
VSAVETRPVETEPEAAARPRGCPRCGAGLTAEQDWCLSCGAPASTRIAPAPGWRGPLAIVGAVLALAAAGLAVAFLELTGDAERAARAPVETPAQAAPVPPAPTPTPTPASAEPAAPAPSPAPAAPAAVETWPEGEEAWTVILLSSESRPPADARAGELAAAGTPVGVLHSDDFSSLRPGYWVVFSGRYATVEEAQAAASGLGAAAAGSYARLVKP